MAVSGKNPGRALTVIPGYGIIIFVTSPWGFFTLGEVSGWFNELVFLTSDS